MSSLNKTESNDWTHLLTDPELVGHIGKLLQAYREAAPDKREEALLTAMRQIRKQGTVGASSSASVPDVAPAPSTADSEIASFTGQPATEQAVGPVVSLSSSTHTSAATATSIQAKTPIQEAPAVQTAAATTAPYVEKRSVQPPFVPDLFTPSFGQDRRTFPRIRCFIAVELRCEGWETPVWGNLANVSAGGCLIETVEPVRKSTKLEVGLWANNGKIWVKGIVINGIVTENNPTFGVRLRYTDMDASERETLRFFLKFVEDTTKSYEKQNGYLAQLKR